MLKTGVRLRGLQPQIVLAYVILTNSFWDFFDVDEEPVITSCSDGKHRFGSLHYSGNAIDIRTRDLPDDKVEAWVVKLKLDLGMEFDVIWEDRGGPNQHIHIEYQPKRET